jgi:hypothetical protein
VIVLQYVPAVGKFALLGLGPYLEQRSYATDQQTYINSLEFQDLNPWDGLYYSCGSELKVGMQEFFKHDPVTGKLRLLADNVTPDTLRLSSPVYNVQGSCFTPNGHLFVSENARFPGYYLYKRVSYFSALNGHKYGEIYVSAPKTSEDLPDEIEGVGYCPVVTESGVRSQIHVVMLRNNWPGDDGIFLPHYCAEYPDLV